MNRPCHWTKNALRTCKQPSVRSKWIWENTHGMYFNYFKIRRMIMMTQTLDLSIYHWNTICLGLCLQDVYSTTNFTDNVLRCFTMFTKILPNSWWRHQMKAFSALLALCAGNSPVIIEFSAQRPVTRSFDVFFDLRMNKRLSKQSWGWWFETPSHPLWRHSHVQFASLV